MKIVEYFQEIKKQICPNFKQTSENLMKILENFKKIM